MQLNCSSPVMGGRTMDVQTNVGNTNTHEILNPIAPIAMKLTCEEKGCYPLSTMSNNELSWKSELREPRPSMNFLQPSNFSGESRNSLTPYKT
jgi:hypothetical protein